MLISPRLKRMLTIATLLVALGAMLSACSAIPVADKKDAAANSNAAAEAEMLRQLDWFYKGQYARVYTRLHPAQQALVSRERYIECNNAARQDVKMKVIESYRDYVQILGTTKTANATEVTVRFTFHDGASVTHTFPLVDIGGGDWRWLNDPSEYDNGGCPP